MVTSYVWSLKIKYTCPRLDKICKTKIYRPNIITVNKNFGEIHYQYISYKCLLCGIEHEIELGD